MQTLASTQTMQHELLTGNGPELMDTNRGVSKMTFVQNVLKGFKIPKLSFRKVNNEKGLTLIELLAIIVILAIIAVIAIPQINAVINQSERKAHRANAHMVIDAARTMVSSLGFTPAAGANTQTISLQDLVDNGFLNAIPKNPNDKPNTYHATSSSVLVTRNITNTGQPNEVIQFEYHVTLANLTGTSILDADEDAIDTATLN